MSFLTNKHVVVALLVAPILAVVSYLAVDKFVSPPAIKAKPGDSFPLVAKSNCRYESGKCTLANGEFEISLIPITGKNNALALSIESEFPIKGAQFAIVNSSGNEIASGKSDNNVMSMQSELEDLSASALRLAINSADVIYFAETQLTFLNKNF